MVTFKKGLYKLNKEPNFNFQLNRLINWGGGDLKEVLDICENIKNSDDWKRELIQLGNNAFKNGCLKTACAYYRMSEFFMDDKDEDKLKFYRKSVDIFYNINKKFFDNSEVERLSVPYHGISLPVLHAFAKGKVKGTILFHGGNDSYYEELFYPMLYFAESGFEIYLFEGPGQGGVLRESHMHFTHEWEKPVCAVINEFNLKDVILIGVSLGGMLAPRAAAFEKKIRYVVCWSLFPSFLSVALYELPMILKQIIKWMIKYNRKREINFLIYKLMKKDPLIKWALKHGMYAYKADTPFEYMKKLDKYKMVNIAYKIDQHVLILHGKDDHFIDWHLYKDVVDSLVNAKSISLRLFTKEELASNHCQCGNTKLALDTIISWLLLIKEKA